MAIRRRLFATYLLTSLALVAVAGGLLYDTVTDEARGAIESRLATEVRMLAVDLSGPGAPTDERALDEHVDALSEAADARITVIGPDGAVLADSEFDGDALAGLDNHAGRAEVRAALAAGEGRSVRYSRSVDVEMLYLGRRIDSGPWVGGVARMAVPLTRVREAGRAALGELALALGLALAAALAAAFVSARRLSRPIRHLRETAARVVAGDVAARARVETGDELEDLAHDLNAATARLADRIAVATAERDRLEGVLEAMAEGVVVTDAEGHIALANAALVAMFGAAAPVEGRTPLEALRHPEAADALRETARGGAVARDVAVRWPDERVLALRAVRLPTGGVIGVFRDVTERRRLDAVRRDFVANVSHELRTPLATLAGHAEELADHAVTPEQAASSAEVIRRHAARMTALVEDLLELARLEASSFAPDREPIDLGELVREVGREWAPRMEAAGTSFEVDAKPGLVISADPRLLRQALAHLLDNALKHAGDGAYVRLSARARPEGAELAVTDDGAGIAAADQARIFERFYRVDKGRSRETGGTGLGLAIVKHVAEAHGGKATVHSRPGAGSTFRIVLPLGAASPAAASESRS